MRAQLLSFSCALFISFLFERVNASCYYPDGSFPTDYIYADCSNDESTIGACCILSEGNQCLSNGLCYETWSGYMFRGGCNDKTWNSTACFQHCKTGDSASTYDRIVECSKDKYCCYSDGDTCCNDDSKVFSFDKPSIIKNLGTTAFTLPWASELPTQAPVASQTEESPAAETSPADATDSNPSIPKATTGTRVANTAAAASSTNQSAAGSNSESGGLSKTALIAIAVAGVIVLLVAIGLVWFCVRRRYRKRLAAGNKPLSSDFQKLPDKTPRPVEVPAPHTPAPPYQPPSYYSPPSQQHAVEIDNSYLPPGRNQYGQQVFEAPAQPYRGI